MQSFDFLTPFYRKQFTRESFLAELDGLLAAERHLVVRTLPFYWPRLSTAWGQGFSSGQHEVALVNAGQGIVQYTIAFKHTKQGHQKVDQARVFLYQHQRYPDVYTAFTLDSREFLDKSLRRLLRNNRPGVLTTFLTHTRLQRLLESFSESEQLDLTIKRASVRVRLESARRKAKTMPMVSWPDFSLSEAFDWVHQENGWFRAIHCEALGRSCLFKFSINRRGEVTTSGMLESIFRAFLAPVCRILHENVEFFGRRSRGETPKRLARPVVVEFGEDCFAQREDNERFISAMREYDRASVSVIHSNPYIHLSVLDHYDGSSFELWVLRSDRLDIVPQFRASVHAIKRVVRHVYDTYAEGHLRDFEETTT